MPIRAPIRMPICVRAFSLITLLLGAAACGEPGSSVATPLAGGRGHLQRNRFRRRPALDDPADRAGGLGNRFVPRDGLEHAGPSTSCAAPSRAACSSCACSARRGIRRRTPWVQRPFRSGAVRGRGVLGIAERILGGALRTPNYVPYQLVLIGGVPHPAGQ